MTDITAADWQRIRPLLDAVLDAPVDQRAALLDTLCPDDAALRARITEYVAAEARAQELLVQPVQSFAPELIHALYGADESAAGARIGPYRLRQRLAHGGMADVYLAERADQQFEQRVALKLLRGGDPELEHRFRAERQILASLNHPGIARLLDGGVTAAGVPFLVMEYVDGEAIDRFCDRQRLTIADRLRLFLEVADAVSCAHRNLIVHRDLKPSNILITADGQVKLLDFGIAKLLTESASGAPDTPTQHWLTPEYAAPEQLRGEAVTTATDVYQLGAVLYELLTGRRPFSPQLAATPGRAYESPRRPSSTIPRRAPPAAASADAAALLVSEARGVSPARLRRQLRGDLDAIVLKAMRDEPDQRYLTVDGLRDDVERHLQQRPVRARHGTTSYRARRFVRRNRWSVAAAATFVLLLAGYGVTITVQRERVRHALVAATEEQQKAEVARQFLMGLFGPGDSAAAQNPEAARALLQRGEEQANAMRGQPLAQAQLLSVLGTVYHSINVVDRAQTLAQRALDLRRAALGDEHADVAASMVQLATVMRDRGEYDQARAWYQRALPIQRRVHGPESSAVAQTLYYLARITGTPPQESLALARAALEVRQRALGTQHPLVAEDMSFYAALLRRAGELAEAERLLRASLDIRVRTLGPDHHDISRGMRQLSYVVRSNGRQAEAEQLQRDALRMHERLYGPDHAEVAIVLVSVGNFLAEAQRYDEAEPLLRRALTITERVHGAESLNLASPLANLAQLLHHQRAYAESESLKRRELAIRRATLGRRHTTVAGALHDLGVMLMERGQLAEAERLLLEARALRAELFGAAHVEAVLMSHALGRLARLRRDYAAAESLHVNVLRALRSQGFVEASENVRRAHLELALVYDEWGQPHRAASQRDSARASR